MKSDGSKNLSLVISGDFSEESVFYRGDSVAVYGDNKCSQKITSDLSYNFAPQTIKLNADISLKEYKKYVFHLGVLQSSSLIKCLNTGIAYAKNPPMPKGFALKRE